MGVLSNESQMQIQVYASSSAIILIFPTLLPAGRSWNIALAEDFRTGHLVLEPRLILRRRSVYLHSHLEQTI